MIPRMTEVFIIEANVTSLAQMNKLPISVAQRINDYDRQNAPQLAAIFANRYLQKAKQAGGNFEQEIANDVDSFLSSPGFAERIVLWIKKNPSKKQQIVDMAKKDWRMFTQQLTDVWNGKSSDEEMKKRATVKFPDGFFWVKLEDRECDQEGDMMQHCGRATGDMYSLRDGNNKPHVTIDIDKPMKQSAIDLDSDGDDPDDFEDHQAIFQLRGKQNAAPDQKYWQYIKPLLKKLQVKSLLDTIDLPEKELEKLAQAISPTENATPIQGTNQKLKGFSFV